MKTYVIYDGRARSDIDSATALDTADTLEEAREAVRVYGLDSVIVEYDQEVKDGQSELSNPRITQ
jgi:hypothetical protein